MYIGTITHVLYKFVPSIIMVYETRQIIYHTYQPVTHKSTEDNKHNNTSQNYDFSQHTESRVKTSLYLPMKIS